MTAEIAVMNTKAVALAADSAVTINYGEKVYHSVDKLFQLSCVHPVGVMFYGRDNFLNIPWETIIKSYRQRLKDAHFPTVSAYARDFFQFLQQAEFDAASKNGREALFVLEAIQMELKAMEKKLTDLKNRLFKKLGEFVPHDEKMKIYNTGIDYQLENYYLSEIEKMLETIPKQMKQLVKTKWDAADLDALEAEMYVKLIQLYRDFNEKIQRFKEKRFIDPIIYNVQVLPKKELAEMAEALVQLTSFKRKVTAAVESVGGPIDVAVISKSDGFVWFKKSRRYSVCLCENRLPYG